MLRIYIYIYDISSLRVKQGLSRAAQPVKEFSACFINNSLPDPDLIFMDSCIVDDSVEIPTRCSIVIEFIIPRFIEGSACFERHTAHHLEF